MGISHIPAHACYLSSCCCASPSRAWIPLLSTFPPGSCNCSEVASFPPLPKAEPAHSSPPPLICIVLQFQPSQGPSTGIIPVCQCLSSSGSPNLGRAPGVVSPMLSIWEGSLSPAGAALGVEAALLHGSTPASWPGCVTPGSQGLFSRPAPSWLATFCHHR